MMNPFRQQLLQAQNKQYTKNTVQKPVAKNNAIRRAPIDNCPTFNMTLLDAVVQQAPNYINAQNTITEQTAALIQANEKIKEQTCTINNAIQTISMGFSPLINTYSQLKLSQATILPTGYSKCQQGDIPCASDINCPTTHQCDQQTGTCIVANNDPRFCLFDTTCPYGQVCKNMTCRAKNYCENDSFCNSAALETCNTSTNTCVTTTP